MIKKELLAIPQTDPPDIDYFPHNGVEVIARAQTGMAGCKEILNIDLYMLRHELDDDMKLEEWPELKARYFADVWDGQFMAWIIPEGNIWKAAGIDNIARLAKGNMMSQNGNYYWRSLPEWEFATDEDSSIARSYLKEFSVQRWENEIRSQVYYTRLSRKQRKINDMMDTCIPDLPEGFFTWMHETVFGRDYLFQKKGDGKTDMFCTSCGDSWEQEKAYRTGYVICPKCGKKVMATFQAEHRSKEEQLFLLQKCDGIDNWVERTFRARAYWENGRKKLVKYDEQIRIIIPRGGNWGKCYYEVFVRRDGRGEYFDRNSGQCRIKAGYLYPGNLDETRDMWQQELRHSGIERLAAEGIRANINRLIINAEDWPFLEYLIKGRFYTLATEIINDGVHLDFGMLNCYGSDSPMKLMRIGPSQVDRLRQQDGGFIMLSWLQYEWDTNLKVSPENLAYLEKKGISANGQNITTALEYLTPNQLVHYIRKQMEMEGTDFFGGTLSTYCDYLDMAKKQRLNLKSEIFYKPKNLQTAHDACVLEGKRHEIELKAKGILEKFPNLTNVLARIRTKYSYDGKEYCIIVPENVGDIIREGRSLGHCIDTTDRYFDRISQDISYLVFLREANEKDTPWYTLEIEPGGTIRQQRTTGNNQNKKDVEAYMPFIREWQKEVRKRITLEDQSLARQSKEIRIKEYQELREKQEKVWHGKLAGKLLADVLEADLIETE